jgi:inner membrane protein
MLLDMVWWHWMVLGLVLAALELVSPGTFFIIFFGVGALAVGVLALFNLAGPVWVQWLLFSIISVLALLLFRNPLLRLVRADTAASSAVDALTNDIAVAMDNMPPGEMGRAELRGSAWAARNAGTTPIKKGQRCMVQRVEGLMLHVIPEGAR